MSELHPTSKREHQNTFSKCLSKKMIKPFGNPNSICAISFRWQKKERLEMKSTSSRHPLAGKSLTMKATEVVKMHISTGAVRAVVSESGKSVTVLSGSPARYLTPEWKDHRSEIARDQLIKNGTLTKPDSKGNMIFTRDWTASSRTRATEIIMGGRRSSAKAWWIDDIGEFLSESTAGK
ncbi:MAG: hypothetical protein ACJA1L_002851 [Paracoccaceae bacterium]|jgi:hypothetical protein